MSLRLEFAGQSFATRGIHGWFSEALEELQSCLPAGTFIPCCFNCALSHYSPGGYGFFGCLACFGGQKAPARAARCKREKFALCFDGGGVTEWVQETHLCPEFEPRDFTVVKV